MTIVRRPQSRLSRQVASNNSNKLCRSSFLLYILLIGSTLWVGYCVLFYNNSVQNYSGLQLSENINQLSQFSQRLLHNASLLITSHQKSISTINVQGTEVSEEVRLRADSSLLKQKEEVISQQYTPPHISEEEMKERSMHIVFSTDCTPFQDWQTLVLFHNAKALGQKGKLIRIASGCEASKQIKLKELYARLHPEYSVHFTPDFKTDAKSQKKYDFYNKPYGVLHWLDHSSPPIPDDVIVSIIDPDFVFLRPLTVRVKDKDNTIVTGSVDASKVFEFAGPGKAVAQQYGLGAPWVNDRHKDFNRTFVCGTNSPCLNVKTENEGSTYYSVGPPYILAKTDLHRIAKTWTTFVPRVYEKYPDLLAEMYAYSMAAAHEELPHLRMDHFMVSNIDAGGEGWPWVDALGDDVCQPPVDGIYYPTKPLPTFAHYCQFYRAEKIGYHKRRMPGDIFSCEKPLLVDIPPSLAFVDHKNRDGEIVKMSKTAVRRSVFMLSVIHGSINAALIDFKNRTCQGNPNTNYQKTLNLALIAY